MENKDTLQYFHNAESKYTVCIDVPSKEELMLMVGMCLTYDKKTVTLNVGIAKCHPKDRYVRKTGREISSQNLEEIEYYIQSIFFISDNCYDIKLVNKTGNTLTTVTMEVKKDIKRVYFVNFNTYE